ncbi:hypothetical protein ABQX22_21505, partial [Xanthomonas sp. WHRI 1810A]|uniref:hypothetical protein n=1 Tax=Xanthomonas sp. WHRI 1810A TaxID=3161565 RepID=UPI0032E91188
MIITLLRVTAPRLSILAEGRGSWLVLRWGAQRPWNQTPEVCQSKPHPEVLLPLRGQARPGQIAGQATLLRLRQKPIADLLPITYPVG